MGRKHPHPHLVQYGVGVSLKVLVDVHRNAGSYNLAGNFQIILSGSPPGVGVP